jgi:hypothetical protein
MRSLLLALLLLPLPALAEDEASKLKLVQYMLKTPTADADPNLVAPFMELDADALPKKYRDKAKAKQLEIKSLLKISKGKKKGPFRYPEACQPKRYGPEGIQVMNMILGNQEVEIEEVEYIKAKTSCTEDQLICEFTLNVVVLPRKDKPPLVKFYLMESDPLMALVAEKRGGGGSAGNKYFQELKPSCQQSFK